MTDTTAPNIDLDLTSSMPSSVTRPPALAADLFDQLLHRPPATTEVTIAVDPNDAFEFEGIRATLIGRRAAAKRDPDNEEKQQIAEEAQIEHDEFLERVDTVTFKFGSIGSTRMEELVNAWPASQEAIDKYRKQAGDSKAMLQWDPDDYPPRLFAACCLGAKFSNGTRIEGFSEDQAVALWDEWQPSDLTELTAAALRVNQRTSKIESLGKG